jgi:hypothetical protein
MKPPSDGKDFDEVKLSQLQPMKAWVEVVCDAKLVLRCRAVLGGTAGPDGIRDIRRTRIRKRLHLLFGIYLGILIQFPLQLEELT